MCILFDVIDINWEKNNDIFYMVLLLILITHNWKFGDNFGASKLKTMKDKSFILKTI